MKKHKHVEPKAVYESKAAEESIKIRRSHAINLEKYYGLADAHGIETFEPYSNKATDKFPYNMRAQLNRQRHALYFEIEIEKVDANIVKALLEKKDFIGAFKFIKKRAVIIGFPKENRPEYERSWELIPNPKLDPWR